MVETERTAGTGDRGRLRLAAPLNTLGPADRRLAVVLFTGLTVLWASLRNGDMMSAWIQADVTSYVQLAAGHVERVPAPFTARPLAPLLAHALANAFHTWTEGGFEVLAFLCLLATAGIVFALAVRTEAPRWWLPALALLPFWAQLLGSAGLPDPLYAALLGGFLLLLQTRRLLGAAALLLPLMLTRESTTLTLACFLLVAWRPLGWRGVGLAIAATALGAALVHRLSAGGLPNPEHLSGGVYLFGKVAANTLRSLGIVPWSNVYPVLCPAPAWQMPLHLGAVRAVGVCSWAPGLLVAAWWAVLTVFGLLPLFCIALLPAWRREAGPALRRLLHTEGDPLLRFSAVYGGISLLLGPVLGLSYTRLVGYGWPLLLIALPRMWARAQNNLRRLAPNARQPRFWTGALLLLHLLVALVGLRPLHRHTLVAVLGLWGLALALVLVRGRSLAGVAKRT